MCRYSEVESESFAVDLCQQLRNSQFWYKTLIYLICIVKMLLEEILELKIRNYLPVRE